MSHCETLTCSCWSSQSQRCQVSQLTAGPLQNPLISCKWQRWFCPRPKGKVFHKWPGSRTERSWLIIHSNTKKSTPISPKCGHFGPGCLWYRLVVKDSIVKGAMCKKFVVKHKTKRFPWWEFKKALQLHSIRWFCFLYYILRRRDVACSDKLHLCLTWISVSDLTLTKASLPSTAWSEVRALVTLSLAVMKERWVRHFSSSLGATWDDGTHTVSSASRLNPFICSCENKNHTYLQQLADHVEMVWCDDVAGL